MRTLLLGLAGVTAGLAVPLLGRADEPPLQVQLQLDGKAYEMTEGKQTTLRIGDRDVKALLTIKPTRHFAAAGLAFDYPRGMAFDFEDEMWTLNGDELIVIVHRFVTDDGGADELAEEFLAATAKELDEEARRPERATIELGGKRHRCFRGKANYDGSTFHLTTVGFVADDRPVVLMLQDMRDTGAAQSASTKRTLELLQKTLVVDK